MSPRTRCSLASRALLLLAAVLGAGGSRLAIGVGGAAELEKWAEKYCMGGMMGAGFGASGEPAWDTECERIVAEEEDRCKKWEEAQQSGSKFAKAQGMFQHGIKCRKYRAVKGRIQEELASPVPRHIGEAVRACEPAVQKVCADALCPTQHNMKGKAYTAEDCEQQCDETAKMMFSTGSLDCREDEPFSECLGGLQSRLRVAGRNPELEAIMREHTLKCVCVSWRQGSSRDICYRGGMGIPQGTKWCEFEKTPSWQRVLKGREQKPGAYIKPTCEEFPYKADA